MPGLGEAQPLDGRPDWVAVTLPDARQLPVAQVKVSEACGRSPTRDPAARLRARGRAPQRRVPVDDGGRLTWARLGRRGAQELRDLWLGGRGLLLLLAFSVLVSAITYLGATSEGINFLEKRETVNLTLQVAVAFGALVALLAAADAISGERERGTLESLLLTPRRAATSCPASCSRRCRCGSPR